MTTGYNICKKCNGKVILSARSGNKQESKFKDICLSCYNNLDKEFKEQLKNKPLSVFDDCIECNNESRLLKGLCFNCWCKYTKGII